MPSQPFIADKTASGFFKSAFLKFTLSLSSLNFEKIFRKVFSLDMSLIVPTT